VVSERQKCASSAICKVADRGSPSGHDRPFLHVDIIDKTGPLRTFVPNASNGRSQPEMDIGFALATDGTACRSSGERPFASNEAKTGGRSGEHGHRGISYRAIEHSCLKRPSQRN
jgi:hypothetical protein